MERTDNSSLVTSSSIFPFPFFLPIHLFSLSTIQYSRPELIFLQPHGENASEFLQKCQHKWYILPLCKHANLLLYHKYSAIQVALLIDHSCTSLCLPVTMNLVKKPSPLSTGDRKADTGVNTVLNNMKMCIEWPQPAVFLIVFCFFDIVQWPQTDLASADPQLRPIQLF